VLPVHAPHEGDMESTVITCTYENSIGKDQKSCALLLTARETDASTSSTDGGVTQVATVGEMTVAVTTCDPFSWQTNRPVVDEPAASDGQARSATYRTFSWLTSVTLPL